MKAVSGAYLVFTTLVVVIHYGVGLVSFLWLRVYGYWVVTNKNTQGIMRHFTLFKMLLPYSVLIITLSKTARYVSQST